MSHSRNLHFCLFAFFNANVSSGAHQLSGTHFILHPRPPRAPVPDHLPTFSPPRPLRFPLLPFLSAATLPCLPLGKEMRRGYRCKYIRPAPLTPPPPRCLVTHHPPETEAKRVQLGREEGQRMGGRGGRARAIRWGGKKTKPARGKHLIGAPRKECGDCSCVRFEFITIQSLLLAEENTKESAKPFTKPHYFSGLSSILLLFFFR